jgi:hypothetical protein
MRKGRIWVSMAEIHGEELNPLAMRKYTKPPSVEGGVVTGRVTGEGNGIRLAAVRDPEPTIDRTEPSSAQ